MAKIIWTQTALADTNAIAEYIALDSVFYAKQFVERIFLATDKLQRYPEIGTIVQELPGQNYREILFRKYRIIYRIVSSDVYIISVHHSSRLLSDNEHFKKLFE
jgi:plasmid stabilization system protein ParE